MARSGQTPRTGEDGQCGVDCCLHHFLRTFPYRLPGTIPPSFPGRTTPFFAHASRLFRGLGWMDRTLSGAIQDRLTATLSTPTCTCRMIYRTPPTPYPPTPPHYPFPTPGSNDTACHRLLFHLRYHTTGRVSRPTCLPAPHTHLYPTSSPPTYPAHQPGLLLPHHACAC